MIFKWLSLFTGLAYIAFGIMVVIKKWFFIPLDNVAAYALGGVMMVYGLFRIGRAIKQIKDNR